MSPVSDKERRSLFSRELNRVISIIALLHETTVESVERDISEQMKAKGFTLSGAAVTNWRLRAVVPQRAAQIALLVAYCVMRAKGGLHRNWMRLWAHRVLVLASYPDPHDLLAKLFPATPARHNLPARHGELIGREADMRRLVEGLERTLPLTCIVGMAGVGKSMLALEACYRCLPGPQLEMIDPFAAIVWISATDRPSQKRWLDEVLDTIARVFDYTLPVTPEQRLDTIRHLLQQTRTLVVIDNAETIDDADLDKWIEQIPSNSKVLLVTSERSQQPGAWLVDLEGLPPTEAVRLIRERARRLNLTQIERAGDAELLPLVEVTKGNPKALVLALGHIANAISDLPTVVSDLNRADTDARDIFDELYSWHWEALRQHPHAMQALLAISFFVEAVDADALRTVAGLPDQAALTRALRHLLARSLLERAKRKSELPGKTPLPLSLHPLTRAFVMNKLAEDPAWERAARERWVAWYLQFVAQHARRDPRGRAEPDGGLFPAEPVRAQWRNLLAVTEWCAERERYDDVRELWRGDRMRVFANMLGHWADRVRWLGWLIDTAESKDNLSPDDRAFLVDTMSALGWTLTTQQQLEAAARQLSRAWELRDQAEPFALLTLTRHLAWLSIHQKEYARAVEWIERHAALLADVTMSPLERAREEIEILGYRGMICDGQEEYAGAEEYFSKMQAAAQTIEWERACLDAHLLRADVARKIGSYEAAHQLLDAVLPRAERLGQPRVTAFYKRSLAHLELVSGNPGEAQRLAAEALDELQRLGLQSEMAELSKLQEECGALIVGKQPGHSAPPR